MRAQLYVALDTGYIGSAEFTRLGGLAKECSRLLQGFAEKVKGGARAGTQYKAVSRKDPLEDIVKDADPILWEKWYGNK